MTLPEYLYRMKAYSLSRVDKEHDMHLQAWLNARVDDTLKKGDKQVPKFKSFKEFYDYEERIAEIEKPKEAKLNDEHKRLAQLAAHVNS